MSLEQETVVIDDLTYNTVDEQLDDIDYFEIITMDEMIKDNPTFIAFSKEEIFDELYNFFENTNKAEALTDLFYKDNTKNIENYVFIADATKKQHECFDIDSISDMISTIVSYRKIQYDIAKKEINKYFFALSYDINSKNIRLKPYMKTIIQVTADDKSKNINIYYPIYPEDETNIPILAAYYKTPTATKYDYLSKQIVSHYNKSQKFNLAQADYFTDIDKLINVIKPKMETILNNIDVKEDNVEDLDYNNIDNILRAFNTSLQDIDVAEFKQLQNHMSAILDIKPHDIQYKNFVVRKLKTINNKLNFYDSIKQSIKLLSITDKVKEDNDAILTSLAEQKVQLNAAPIVYNNMNDILNAIRNNEIELESIIENVKNIRNVIAIDNAMKNIQDMQEYTNEHIENVTNNVKELVKEFDKIKRESKDIYELHFLDFYRELSEVKQGNDYSDYEGVPEELKNVPNFENYTDIEMFENDDNISNDNIQNISLEKFWLHTRYSHSIGFVEMLKIILPLIQKIQEISKLPLQYDVICNELYNHFSGVPTKFRIMSKILQDNNVEKKETEIKDIIALNPNFVLNQKDYKDDISLYVKECNKQFIEILFDMMYTAIAKWSLDIQDYIIDDMYIINENDFPATYYDKWSRTGLLADINSKESILEYIVAITYDMLEDKKIYTVPKKIKEDIVNIINNKMKAYYLQIKNSNMQNIKNKVNKGRDFYHKLRELAKKNQINDLLNNYIKALIYMPEYKFQKHHKFLLGCCMQKLGNDFKAFNDMIGVDHRKYLLKSRKHFAKNRKTSQKSINIYYPIDDNKLTKKTSVVSKYELPTITIDTEKKQMNDWLQEMKNVSPLLSNEIIEMMKKDLKQVVDTTEQYFNIFCKTANIKKKDALKMMLFKNDSLNFYNIFNLVCRVLNKQLLTNQYQDEEVTLLRRSIRDVNNIVLEINKLQQIATEYSALEIKKIINYIMIVSLCLPFDPYNSKDNNNVLIYSGNASSNFVNNIVVNMYSSLMEYLKNVRMPTLEENINYRNSIRETNKNKLLNTMNNQTTDDRNLMLELKKIGVKHEMNNNDNDIDINDNTEQVDNDFENDNNDNDFEDDYSEDDYSDNEMY